MVLLTQPRRTQRELDRSFTPSFFNLSSSSKCEFPRRSSPNSPLPVSGLLPLAFTNLSSSLTCEDESQVEKEARTPLEEEEKKDESEIVSLLASLSGRVPMNKTNTPPASNLLAVHLSSMAKLELNAKHDETLISREPPSA